MRSANYFTLADLATRTADGRLVLVIPEFKRGLTFYNEIPWKEASHIDKDEGVFLKQEAHMSRAFPLSLGEGYSFAKSSYYKRSTALGIVGSAVNFDEMTMQLMPDQAVYMQEQIQEMIHCFGQDCEYMLLNMSQDNNPAYPEGLLPKYSLITDIYGEILDTAGQRTGVKTPYVCLDALGAKDDASRDGNLSSVLLVYFDNVSGVSCLYPRGSSTVGFRYKVDPDYHWTTLENGTHKRELTATIDLTCGVTVNNALACCRIANVDPQDETSLKTMMNLLFAAYERTDNYMKDGLRIFTTTEVITAIKQLQYKSIYHSTLSGVQALNLKGELTVDDDKWTNCNSMLHTEGRILGATA